MSAADSRTQWNTDYRNKGAATRNYKWVVNHLAAHQAQWGEFRVTLEPAHNSFGQAVWQIWSEPVRQH